MPGNATGLSSSSLMMKSTPGPISEVPSEVSCSARVGSWSDDLQLRLTANRPTRARSVTGGYADVHMIRGELQDGHATPGINRQGCCVAECDCCGATSTARNDIPSGEGLDDRGSSVERLVCRRRRPGH